MADPALEAAAEAVNLDLKRQMEAVPAPGREFRPYKLDGRRRHDQP